MNCFRAFRDVCIFAAVIPSRTHRWPRDLITLKVINGESAFALSNSARSFSISIDNKNHDNKRIIGDKQNILNSSSFLLFFSLLFELCDLCVCRSFSSPPLIEFGRFPVWLFILGINK